MIMSEVKEGIQIDPTAKVVKENITDEDRKDYFRLIPAGWITFDTKQLEERTRKVNSINQQH